MDDLLITQPDEELSLIEEAEKEGERIKKEIDDATKEREEANGEKEKGFG